MNAALLDRRGREGTGRGVGDDVDAAPARIGWVALALAAATIVATWVIGRRLQADGFRLFTTLPPLTGHLDPRLPPGSAAPVLVAALVIGAGPRLARRLGWGAMLVASGVAALAWSASLAVVDGAAGFLDPVLREGDYLAALPSVGAPGAFLEGFVAGIDRYPTHVRAHPPGLVVALWWLERAGLGGAATFAALQHLVAASAVPAVLLAVREVATSAIARRVAPFLVLAPAAVAVGSGDAIFLGVGAWAVAALVLATGAEPRSRRARAWSAVGGVLFGGALFLSYGLVLLAAVPIAVVAARRRPDVVVLAGIGVAAVAAAFAVAGFSWWEGLTATRREYAESVARSRPYAYYLVANLAAFAVALGPAVVAAVPRLRDRRLWLLVGGGLAAVAIADLSGLSKAEVERIWLPFAPWIAVAAAALADRTVPRWLAAQAGWVIAVQLLVRSLW